MKKAFYTTNTNYLPNFSFVPVVKLGENGGYTEVAKMQKVATGYYPLTLEGKQINRYGELSPDSVFNIADNENEAIARINKFLN